jgi:hypothetical protein
VTTSFESRIADLLEEQASREQPPARVSVGTAIRRGNSRLRWQRAGRAGLAGAPAMAASAVIAIALIGTVPIGVRPAAGKYGRSQAAVSARPAPRAMQTGLLPLLRTAARFGWLPAGEQLRSGLESATMAYMNVDAGSVFSWELTIWASGRCFLHSGANDELICSSGSGVAPARYPLGSRAASIHGHEAFWMGSGKQHQEIAWEYASGAWTVFQSPSCCSAAANRQPVATLLQIARGISFGPASGELLSFDFQLTAVPSDWRVSSVSYGAHGVSLLANGADVTGHQSARTGMSISISPGGTGNASPCWSSAPGLTQHTTLRGYEVETATSPLSDSDRGSDAYQLCAPDVDGISFFIKTADHAGRTPTQLFEHMRFLGPNPADWTTNPIG